MILPIPEAERWSQFQDEEIILRALAVAGVRYRACCEIGALDGMRFSNTAYLIRHLGGWHGTLIESDYNRALRCEAWYRRFPNAKVLWREVTPEIINNLVPDRLDFLSIDVDGNDYWLWEALEHRPGVVCIEYNDGAQQESYIPGFRRWEDCRTYGATQERLKALAERKNYEFLESDGHANLFFIDRERLGQ